MKVSVAMLAYNHERFIAQALESVFMQQTNFDYEVVIGEDCSTDATRAIVQKFVQQYPDRMRPRFRDVNWGASRNFVDVAEACNGEYVALLEGDDFWTDPHKLQMQVDMLDAHPEYAICFHNALVTDENGNNESYLSCGPEQKEVSSLADLLEKNFIPTCSAMYRNGLFGAFPDWVVKSLIGDWPLHILNAQHGDIVYLDRVMAAYRIHRGGLRSGASAERRLQMLVTFYEYIDAHLQFRYTSELRASMSKVCWKDASEAALVSHLKQRQVYEAIEEMSTLFEQWSPRVPLSPEQKNKLLGEIYAAFAFEGYKTSDLGLVRHCLVRAVRHDPTWLKNPGVRSIGIEALVGQKITNGIRQIGRKGTRVHQSTR